MGINDLAPHLRDYKNPSNHLSEIKDKVLGIDVSILSVRFLVGDSNVIDRYHMKPKVPYLELIHGYFGNIISVFQKHNVSCVFVFDGCRNPLKSEENERRQSKVTRAEEELKRIYTNAQEVSPTYLRKLKKDAVRVDEYFLAELISYLKRNSQCFIIAPCEADGQLVYLQKKNIVSYIMSEDSDLIALGGTNVIQNINYKTEMCNIVSQDKLDQYFCKMVGTVPTQVDKFAMCIMLGCDYLDNTKQKFNEFIKMWVQNKDEASKLRGLKGLDRGYYKKFNIVYHYFFSQPVFSITSLLDLSNGATITIQPLYLITQNEKKSPEEWTIHWKKIMQQNFEVIAEDNIFFQHVATAILWCRTGNALNDYVLKQKTIIDSKSGVHLELPWGFELDTTSIPLQYHCREALLNFVSARESFNGEIRKGITTEQLISLCRKIMTLNLEATPIVPGMPIGDSQLSVDIYSPVDPSILWISSCDDLITTISNFRCQFDEEWFDKYYTNPEDGPQGGIGVEKRGEVRYHSGHVDIRTMRYTFTTCKRNDTNEMVGIHFFGCNVKPSMIDAINYVQLAFDAEYNYIPSPTSRCACTDGQGFCSHMFAVVLFMRKCQIYPGQSYEWHLKYMPPYVDSVYNEIITAQFISTHK